MSNHLAIATITATLQKMILSAVQGDVYGARVTTTRPINLGSGPSESGVNIFLYQIDFNAALTKQKSTNTTKTRRQTALELYYLISFYGNESELEPQRLLGSVVQTFSDRSVITTEIIRDTLADSSFPFLQDSDLIDQVQQINIVPIDISLDDLSKTWSAFFQTPYILSIVYRVLAVYIDGREPLTASLPITRPSLSGTAPFFNQPLIQQIFAQGDTSQPITATSTLVVRGKILANKLSQAANATQIRLGDVEVTPTEIKDETLILPLTNIPRGNITAGVQSLQVIHRVPTGIKPENVSNPENEPESTFFRKVESNALPFVLCPTIIKINSDGLYGRLDGFYEGTIQIEIDLHVQPQQKVVLALNEWAYPLPDEPVSYLFDAAKVNEATNMISVPITKIKATEYLIRLMVDGAASLLVNDRNQDSPTFGWYISPKIVVGNR